MTTKRASLTPKERQEMLDRQEGKCAWCKTFYGVSKLMIAEHTHPVVLGNADKPDCLVCRDCAHEKTFGRPATTYGSDIHAIAKAKRLAAGGKKRKGPPMQSRPFDTRYRKRMDGRVEKK